MELKPIPNFPGYYVTCTGKVWSFKTKRWLYIYEQPNGYLRVQLWKNNKPHGKFTHQLMLETFVGPCPEGMEACHKNNNKKDNRIENLTWDTHKKNMEDMAKSGVNKGENHWNAKITKQDARTIVYVYKTGLFTQKEIALMFNTVQSVISNIVTGKHWQTKPKKITELETKLNGGK